MSTRRLRLATRGSPQARTQAEGVADELRRATGCAVELVLVETTGDRRQDVPLHVIGGQGVFVKEVQYAVLDGRADIAVHSAKDLPSLPHEALTIGAFMRRRDAADALIGHTLDGLTEGATIATGSVRRRAQLAAVRPDLDFVQLRGNIATRLGKVPGGGAIVMAVAALEVLGLTERVAERLAVEEFVPAVGQGCVAVESRRDDAATAELLAAVDDAATRHAVEVERSFLAELGSGCTLPVGGHVADGVLHVFLASEGPRPSVARDVVALGLDDGDHELARRAAHEARQAVGGR
ncbi:MAG: hydroxymethylbilane synthase [Ilumatobacteraceae bacterium]